MATVLRQRLSRSTDAERHISSFVNYTSKQFLTKFEADLEKDDERLHQLKDYSHFLGKHEGARTYIYVPPESGWMSGAVEKEKRKQQLRKDSMQQSSHILASQQQSSEQIT